MLAPEEFPRGRAVSYLDTATYGLPPSRTLAAVHAAVAAWEQGGSWLAWEAEGEACRELFAGLIGAEAGHVSLQPAVSAAAGIVALSLPAVAGDNVVCYEADFESCIFPFLALERRGVEVRLRPLERLAEACDERTRLVAVSAVQSADGRRADLARLRTTGAPLFVDATQAVGAVPFDLAHVDYAAAAAYKWLLCPRGLCFLWVRSERLPEIEPWLAGWKAHRDPYGAFYGGPRDLADTARRLDISLPWQVAAGARASLSLVAELGVGRIAAHDLALATRFCRALALPDPESPIVQVRLAGAEATAAELRRIGLRCSVRAGALRFAFHLYNDDEDVDRAVAALAPALVGA